MFFEDTFSDNSPPKNRGVEAPAPVDINPTERACLTLPIELPGPERDGLLQLDTFAGQMLTLEKR